MKLRVPEWCCAIRFNSDENISILNDIDSKFCIINNSIRYWSADPFLFKYNDKYFLFFEMFDRIKRKGVLGCREISDSHVGKMNIIYENEFHLSYPYIYQENGNIYIIPECNECGQLFRLVCVDFPLKWKKEKVLLEEHLVDTTLLNYRGVNYYLSERVICPGVFNRLDLFYENDDYIFECKNNPVKIDLCTARSAGKVFENNGILIRPSQDCSKSYGEKISFNGIIELNKDNYFEETLKTISVAEINTNVYNNFTGVHTYNKLDSIEVIDLKIADCFNMLNLIGGVIKRILKR